MSRVEPNRNVYIGHRYVPLLVGEWDKSVSYEGLSIVTFEGGSYTSKKMTPAGIDIENEEYWVLTGNYNAQIEYYRQETERVSDDLAQAKIDLNERIDDTVKDVDDLTIYVDDEVRETKEYVDDEVRKNSKYVDGEVIKITKELDSVVKVINVKNYGAVGDGINDDTQPIRNAISDLKNGDVLYFPTPSDFYKVTVQNEDYIFLINKPNITIISTSQNGIYYPTIKVLGDTVKKSSTVFQYAESGIEAEKIAVWGGDRDHPRVGDIFRNGNEFNTKLRFTNVFSLHAFNNGYNLTTYFSTFEDSQARFISNENGTGKGFNIHGRLSDGLEGTTINFIGTFVDYSDISYDFSYLTYSRLNGVGSDHAKIASYKMYRCYEVSGSSLGSEAFYSKAILLDNCLNVNIEGLRGIVDPSKDDKYSITLKSSTNCTIKGIRMNTPVFSEIIYGSQNEVETPSIFSNAVDNTHVAGYESYQHKFKLVRRDTNDEVVTADDFYDIIQDTNTAGNSSKKQLLKHVYLDKDYVLKVNTPSTPISQTQAISKNIKGVRGNKLFIKGNNSNKNLNFIDVGTNNSFKVEDNNSEIIFENITFYSFYQGDTMFNFKNTTVRFKNCVINPIGSDISYRAKHIFNLENSNVIIERDTQLLGSSDQMFAVKDNNSSIEFKDPTGTVPKFHTYHRLNPDTIDDIIYNVEDSYIDLQLRKTSTSYEENTKVLIGNNIYISKNEGITSTGTLNDSQTIQDGSVLWELVSPVPFINHAVDRTYTTNDYVFINNHGLFKIISGGTVDVISDIVDVEVSRNVEISQSGIRARKVSTYKEHLR